MSRSHRDENDLAEPSVDDTQAVVAPPAPATVANNEAERRAAERRKAEGAAEQIVQHEFTGDLPEPTRGGTETETRLVFGEGGDDDDASRKPGASIRRGPPAPRARHVEDDSWAAPAMLDGQNAGALLADAASWVAAR